MANKNGIALFVCFLFFQSTFAQKNKDSLALRFDLKFDNTILAQNQKYISKHDTLQIETFKFYISNIEIHYTDKSSFKPLNRYHLIDLDVPASQRIPIDFYQKKQIQNITFNIGIDSLASVSGALGGDLDPAKGMYWAWQSGYINMKIEGKSPSCKTRKNEFQFHIGGYLKPNNTMRTVEIPMLHFEIPDSNEIVIRVDLAKLFSEIALSKSNSIMIPGKEAMKIADLSAKLFSTE